MSRGTQEPLGAGSRFRLQGCHLLWPAFPGRSANAPRTPFRRSPAYRGPTTPDSPRGSPGLGCSGFARRYCRNHGCFLFLWVLRWFTSPGAPRTAMDSPHDSRCSHRLGSPIRRSPDHSLLAAPRGLSQLAASFIARLRLGIHTHALSSLTTRFTPDTGSSHGRLHARGLLFTDPDTNLCLDCPSIFTCQRSARPGALSRWRENLMVGLGRVELPTSPLSGVRSNHLSYRPSAPSEPLAWWS